MGLLLIKPAERMLLFTGTDTLLMPCRYKPMVRASTGILCRQLDMVLNYNGLGEENQSKITPWPCPSAPRTPTPSDIASCAEVRPRTRRRLQT